MPDRTDRVAQQLWGFVYDYDAAYERAARAVGLSTAQACLLKAVADGPRTMGEIATELLCDASNVTQVVTRLEARGLVTRQPGRADRRSREVAITAAGAELDRSARQAFRFPRERIGRLSADDQQTLSTLLETLAAPDS
ncbi:MarR family winged helix-turn-helix transcriptional regulator [Desertihabitans aurantiacus]|uniref:MarR family winged helix-turn-helix transcriptional regulator n=1 Tax=Desertihabitans aurantiacus TaxID=2282477 RepID=UPI000DF76C97|nr:MarR family transcriptional regulator [Desertihabitans aurantiacus]